MIEAIKQNLWKLDPCALGDRYAIPKPAMREQVVVLTLVPGPISQQPLGEMHRQARLAPHRLVDVIRSIEQRRGSDQRGVVPDLPIGHPLIKRPDQLPTRLEHAIEEPMTDGGGRFAE